MYRRFRKYITANPTESNNKVSGIRLTLDKSTHDVHREKYESNIIRLNLVVMYSSRHSGSGGSR